MENEQNHVIIENKIFIVRGFKVMLDADLASLYGIETKILVQSIKRNTERFPSDFMFQLSEEEFKSLRSQIVTSKIGRGGRRYVPYVFTEHGVAMLSAVLNSQRAVTMSIFIVRAFIKMRELLSTHADLAEKIAEIEQKQKEQGSQLSTVCLIVKQLVTEPDQVKSFRKIGFNLNLL
jgi:phage regulator Rha-like protein